MSIINLRGIFRPIAYAILPVLLTTNTVAALDDEVVQFCFNVDDELDFTTEELLKLRLIRLGGGMYVGTAHLDFIADTGEVDGGSIDFDVVMTASALVKSNGMVELTMTGADFVRPLANPTEEKRFTRAIVEFDSSLSGTGRGFTESESTPDQYYSVTLRPVDCPLAEGDGDGD